MTEFLYNYGLFFAKAVTIVGAVVIAVAMLANLFRQVRAQAADHLEVKDLNRRFRDLADSVRQGFLSPDELKRELKSRKAEDKARAKARKNDGSPRPRVYVLDFHGDLAASAVASLREEISAVLQVAREGDETLLRLESEGGAVHGYGLAASQLARLRERKLPLTVAVDKAALSGGYLMACVADRILSAPFAAVGSIGVVGQLLNFNRLLKRHDVDYELHTAGEFKRTLSLFGENTEDGRAKFREMLEDAHALFKGYIAQYRPQVDLARVATGEHWYGTRALELKLVDRLATSDDYLLERSKDADLFELRYRRHRTWMERFSGRTAQERATFPLF